ncbi:sorting nexin-29-like isoform X2 [Oscarella lobularis]|uniref:sorting nexin-29-like isoform X2 n=1 Tax=Oscarella lobularis TaxID=121494 RepID=UPI003313DAB9
MCMYVTTIVIVCSLSSNGRGFVASMNISIPSTRLVENEGYTVYQLRVVTKETNQIVSKRYSEFFELHKKLRKFLRPHPDFPSKRWVKKTHPKVVEYRRKGLETYIQELVSFDPVPELVLEFLDVEKYGKKRTERSSSAVNVTPAATAATAATRRATDVDSFDGRPQAKKTRSAAPKFSHAPLISFPSSVFQFKQMVESPPPPQENVESRTDNILYDAVLDGIIRGLESR